MQQHPPLRANMRLSPALPDWPKPSAAKEQVIGVLPGEGVGPEVIGAALKVMEVVASHTPTCKFRIASGGKIGLPAAQETGHVLSGEVIAFCDDIFARQGAILCGPGGGRFVYELRNHFDLYCKFTPLRPFGALADTGPLSPLARSGVDIVMVRENTGGAYLGKWGTRQEAGGETAYQHCEYRLDQVQRILQVAANLAAMRRSQLCVTLKPGGVPAISALWEKVLHELTQGTRIQAKVLEVDNAGYQLIAAARDFDVVVSPNMFGDILADCGSLLLASRGMSFSGNFGPAGRAVYQTAHGAAHDLAGTDRANPIGQILSLAMLLRESFAMGGMADAIENAIEEVLSNGWRTADIAACDSRIIGTRQIGSIIASKLEQQLLDSPQLHETSASAC